MRLRGGRKSEGNFFNDVNHILTGSSHCGPFNKVLKKASSKADAVCQKHDKAYARIGPEAYYKFSKADQEFIDTQPNPLLRAVFQLKKQIAPVLEEKESTHLPLKMPKSKKSKQLKALRKLISKGGGGGGGGGGRKVVGVATKFKHKTSKPRMRSGGSNSIIVSHTEYVSDFVGDGTDFVNNGFHINPGLSVSASTSPGVFTWLPVLAGAYERYRFHKLTFQWKTDAPSTEGGSIMMAMDYNFNMSTPASKVALMNINGATRTRVWGDQTFSPISQNRKHFSQERYIRYDSQGLPDSDALGLRDCGEFFLALGNVDTGVLAGELYVHYTVELILPRDPFDLTLRVREPDEQVNFRFGPASKIVGTNFPAARWPSYSGMATRYLPVLPALPGVYFTSGGSTEDYDFESETLSSVDGSEVLLTWLKDNLKFGQFTTADHSPVSAECVLPQSNPLTGFYVLRITCDAGVSEDFADTSTTYDANVLHDNYLCIASANMFGTESGYISTKRGGFQLRNKVVGGAIYVTRRLVPSGIRDVNNTLEFGKMVMTPNGEDYMYTTEIGIDFDALATASADQRTIIAEISGPAARDKWTLSGYNVGSDANLYPFVDSETIVSFIKRPKSGDLVNTFVPASFDDDLWDDTPAAEEEAKEEDSSVWKRTRR